MFFYSLLNVASCQVIAVQKKNNSGNRHTHTHTQNRLQYPRYAPTHSEVNITIYDMSVNIQSVIDYTTWYIAIEVINSVGRDRIEFTNLIEFKLLSL